MSVSRRELAAMRSAGWEIQTFTPWNRVRALVRRRRPVGRPETASRVASARRWTA